MSHWDRVIMVDWSGGNDTGPTPRKDAIWVCASEGGVAEEPLYLRNRVLAEAWLQREMAQAVSSGQRLLVGFDFPFGYPEGFAKAVTGHTDPFALWGEIAGRIEDAPAANNRFDVAADLNRLFPGVGPFWGNGFKRDIADLPRKGLDRRDHGMPEKRAAEKVVRGAFTLWQLAGAGAVGSQVLMGLPVLHRLRGQFADQLRVWPFEALDRAIAFVEIWPSLVVGSAPEGWIKDAWQVAEVARMVSGLEDAELSRLLDVEASHEGWILGLGQEALLQGDPVPPELRNDCFALPSGVEWTPVDAALALLRDRLQPIVGREKVDLFDGTGRVLAEDIHALRAHPPQANTAVDGYGFAGGRPEGAHVLPLVDWRAAAGPMPDKVLPAGQAVRILTGAALPAGVDTVVLQEDVALKSGKIAFHGPVKAGVNTRAAGEDMEQGASVLPAGHRLLPGDLGLLAAVGVGSVQVRKALRVGVLSTGNEIVPPGEIATGGQVFDANRPMLLSLLTQLGHRAVDLGHVPDQRAALQQRFDEAVQQVDVILTSGGASSGDEDHVSALLSAAGAMALWRIAVKPGRPLALGLWQGRPVFGLPGNPVAAMVCTLVFARPAMSVLAGEGWVDPKGFMLPARFSKRKKPGRREYLRARVREGEVEVFASEGSGRISGLSWAEGLVELPEEALDIGPGDPVRYIPWSGFGC